MARRKIVKIINVARVRKPSLKVAIRLPPTVLLDLQLIESSQDEPHDNTPKDNTILKQEQRPQAGRTANDNDESNEKVYVPAFPNHDNYKPLAMPQHQSQGQIIRPGYRKVPPNIYPILENELKVLNPDMEELGIDKIIFSLLDPLSKARIDLPVKSNNCVHFECFDYGSFCMFNKIPQGVQFLLRRAMTKLALELLRFQKAAGYLYSPVKIIDITKQKSSSGKEYKCPICDAKFPLLELTVSISFNYFVKGTPKDVEKIELLEMFQYRPISERESIEKRSQSEEVILLSDEDEEEDEHTQRLQEKLPVQRQVPEQNHDPDSFDDDGMIEEIEAVIQGAHDEDDDITHQHAIPIIDSGSGSDVELPESAPVPFDIALQVLSPYLARYRGEYAHRYGQDQYQGSGSHDDPVTID